MVNRSLQNQLCSLNAALNYRKRGVRRCVATVNRLLKVENDNLL